MAKTQDLFMAACTVESSVERELRRDLAGTSRALSEAQADNARLVRDIGSLVGALRLCVARLEEYPDAIGGIALECGQRVLRETA